MISTNSFDHESFPVPNVWIFQNFLPIDETLEGQTVKIRSLFNAQDKDPSFMVYLDNNNDYKFVDFSAGHKGNGVDLIMLMYNISRQEAYQKIYKLYKEANPDFSYSPSNFIRTVWTVVDYAVRPWNDIDAKYWLQYHVNSDLLDAYNIRPLSHYTFEKQRGDQKEYFVHDKPICYGFFTKAKVLYKIYNPGEKRTKYLKVADYIQGYDQLTFHKPWLIIQSGLKDVIAFKTLNLTGVESIAGDSENCLISPTHIKDLKSKYKYISTLFDNDEAGRKSSQLYLEQYGLQPIQFTIEKDVADCLKEHHIENTKAFLTDVLKKHFLKYLK